jgi:hypothetical protein
MKQSNHSIFKYFRPLGGSGGRNRNDIQHEFSLQFPEVRQSFTSFTSPQIAFANVTKIWQECRIFRHRRSEA